MSKPQYEDLSMHAFMAAPFGAQCMQLRQWGEPQAGLVILMSACEGQCFFCAQPVVTNPPPELITAWPSVEKKMSGNRRIGLKTLLVGGTEPPTHPEFERTLQLAKDCGFEEIQLMTSGLQLVEKGAHWWNLGVRSVCTPIYGLDALTHDSVVGVPGHWEQVVAGLDAADSLGMEIYTHTLSLRRTLSQLSQLGDWVRTRWGRPLAVAPLRPKSDVFSFTEEAPSLSEIRSHLGPSLSLVGFPSCLGAAGESALLTRLYFRSQRRAFAASCEGCNAKPSCNGIVSGHLEHWGDDGLRPT